MYKNLTSKENEHEIATVLLHNEEDFKDILFRKPSHYPVILVTHFNISICKFINHKVYGEYIYLSSFN